MRESDCDYYRRRIAEEASRADDSACEEIKGVHLELLQLYSSRLEALESSPGASGREFLRAV